MPSSALSVFRSHIAECRDAIAIYEHLKKTAGYEAHFNLRFVWIAAVAALDHYVSQLIVERGTFAFGNGLPLQGKLLVEDIPVSSAIDLRTADPISAVLLFRGILEQVVKYRTFQSPEKIADGLAYIWPEQHKWQYIGRKVGVDAKALKAKLSSIVDRRNVIAHSGDYDEGLRRKLPVDRPDAEEVVDFIEAVVVTIDAAVSP